MAHPIKKKDFFNGGRGIVPEDFEGNGLVSPQLGCQHPSLIPQVSEAPPILSTTDFPQRLPTQNGPLPLYPFLQNIVLTSPTFYRPNSLVGSNPFAPHSSSHCFPSPSHIKFHLSAHSPTMDHFAPFGDHPPSPSSPLMGDIFLGGHDFEEYSNRMRRYSGGEEVEPRKRTSAEPRTRQQKCSLCFNHGIIKEKKGHKWQCLFKNCECQRCLITKGRQKTMRDQQKLTRHLQKMQL